MVADNNARVDDNVTGFAPNCPENTFSYDSAGIAMKSVDAATTEESALSGCNYAGKDMFQKRIYEYFYGILKSGCQRKITSTRCILAILSLAYFFSDAVVNGVYSVSLPSVEKQFQLTTTESGIIGSMIDIGACLALIPVIYLGEKIIKPRWLGAGVFVCGLGSIIYSIPQFTSPKYEAGSDITNYCGNVTEINCILSAPLRQYRFILMLGMMLCGVGSEYALTIGVSYLDDNVEQRFSSTYHGIFYSSGALGSAVGYFLTGLAMRIFTYPKESVSINIDSPLWVGAWWIGFIVGGAALFCVALPILSLQKSLPGTEPLRQDREQKRSQEQPSHEYGFRQRIGSLLKNKLFVLISLSFIVHKALLYGFITYGVKIGSDIYGLTESLSAFGLGSMAIVSSVIGLACGGFIVSKFDLTLRGILIFLVGSYAVSFPPTLGFLLPCPPTEFAGAVPSTNGDLIGVENPCNFACGCDTDIYSPVCDENGTLYYSPCHAGCAVRINESEFGDCRCLMGGNSSSSTVSAEKCNESVCANVYPVTAILFVSFLCGFLTSTPTTQGILRSVTFEERTMALAITHVGVLLGGRMLGRLVFSQGLAHACHISSTDCGHTGACRLYDKSAATANIAAIMATGKALSAILAGLALLLHIRQRET